MSSSSAQAGKEDAPARPTDDLPPYLTGDNFTIAASRPLRAGSKDSAAQCNSHSHNLSLSLIPFCLTCCSFFGEFVIEPDRLQHLFHTDGTIMMVPLSHIHTYESCVRPLNYEFIESHLRPSIAVNTYDKTVCSSCVSILIVYVVVSSQKSQLFLQFLYLTLTVSSSSISGMFSYR
jgi:hypothetical protein